MSYQRRSVFNLWATLSLLISGICLATAQSVLESESLYPRSTVFRDVSDYAFYCTIAFHQSALINNKLYIVGGSVAYIANSSSTTRTFLSNTYQRSISIEDAFNPLANDSQNYDKMKSFIDIEALPQAMPELSEGYFWVDEVANEAYLVAGHQQASDLVIPNITAPEKNIGWTYDISNTGTNLSDAWSSFPISPIDAVPIRAFQQGGVFIPGIRQGFLLGGTISQDSDPDIGLLGVQELLSGLLTFDAETKMWTNETTPDTISPRRWSKMVAVPYGGKGTLLVLGGRKPASTFPFTSIDVYDIENKEWYSQITTGAVPDWRQDFCVTVVSASDGLSHQIFMFGGSSDGTIKSDINVLSIPTFEWFSISSTGFGSPGARKASSCDLYGKRHMLVFGGQKPDITCDATGVFLFDMTTLEWETEYPDITAEYEVSSRISRSIGSGNNTKVEPENGFANDRLASLFSTTATAIATATSTSTSTSTADAGSGSSEPDPSGSSKPAAGAIAGAVVGGLAAIALGACVFLLFMRRRRASNQEGLNEHKGDTGDQQAFAYEGTRMQELDPDAMRHELDGQKIHPGYSAGNQNQPAELTA